MVSASSSSLLRLESFFFLEVLEAQILCLTLPFLRNWRMFIGRVFLPTLLSSSEWTLASQSIPLIFQRFPCLQLDKGNKLNDLLKALIILIH